jgi:hypothetical protein
MTSPFPDTLNFHLCLLGGNMFLRNFAELLPKLLAVTLLKTVGLI